MRVKAGFGIPLIVLLCALIFGSSTFSASGTTSIQPMTPDVLAGPSQNGIDVQAASDSSAVSASTATNAAEVALPLASNTSSSYYSTLVTFSDAKSGSEGPNGSVVPEFTGREAWAVTYMGAQIPILGPTSSGGSYKATVVVFVDAKTGAYLEAIAFAEN